ncbi:MAG: hypothetical protein BWZ10_02100 [candidate division BRC1 bacterium ADurb.BinA364]|nr:MAG: hypothetical protein BWZ10_02100 [candidate division BRC1 bacterium ADurb.BinA364]
MSAAAPLASMLSGSASMIIRVHCPPSNIRQTRDGFWVRSAMKISSAPSPSMSASRQAVCWSPGKGTGRLPSALERWVQGIAAGGAAANSGAAQAATSRQAMSQARRAAPKERYG